METLKTLFFEKPCAGLAVRFCNNTAVLSRGADEVYILCTLSFLPVTIATDGVNIFYFLYKMYITDRESVYGLFTPPIILTGAHAIVLAFVILELKNRNTKTVIQKWVLSVFD